MSVACLYGMFSLYALWVTPMVERDEPKVVEQAKAPVVEEGRRGPRSEIAERYLPNTRWAWNSLYQTHDGNRYIFTEKWEKTPGGEVKFEPFAMVVLNDDPEKPPYTLVSKSALLVFENGFDLSDYNPGRIVGGALEQEFEIYGDSGLWLRGHDLFFRETYLPDPQTGIVPDASPRAWSDKLVEFKYDGHYGTGFGLEIELIPDNNSDSQDKPAVSGFRTIRLRKDVEMHLCPQQENPDEPQEHVQVNSAGPFEYDLEANTATYQDQVHVIRRLEKGDETIDGEILTILFRPAEEGDQLDNENRADADSSTGMNNMVFSRLIVTGDQRTGKRAKLHSVGSDATAVMHELTYDADHKTIVMKDGQKVLLRHGDDWLECPELTITHDDNRQIIEIIGRGKGRMVSKDPVTKLPKYIAEWQKQLWKRPDPDSDQQRLELKGRANMREQPKMAIEGEIIRIWLDEDTRPRPLLDGPEERDLPASIGNLVIKKLQAKGDVSFANSKPKLIGSTPKLEIWFEEGKIPRVKSVASGQRQERDRLTQVHLRSAPQAPKKISKPNAQQALASVEQEFEALPPPPVNPQEKEDEEVLLIADYIKAKIIREEKDYHVSVIDARGQVTVEQRHADGEGPFAVEGHRMIILNPDDSGHHHLIKVKGKPATENSREVWAHVQDRGAHLQGMEIHTDRLRNFVEVKSPGVMQQPVNNSLDGRELEAPVPLLVWWQEKMEFDGTTAKFFGNVRINHESTDVTCGQMDVTLTRRVSLIDDRGDQQEKVDIKTITCKEQVNLDSRQFEGERLIGRHRGQLFELHMDQQTGDMKGDGGGWFEIWQREDTQQGPLASNVSATSNQAIRSGGKQEWTYTRIDYRGDLTGNMSSFNSPDRTATTQFEEDVRVVHGPVSLPTGVIDPDQLPEGAGTLESRSLQLRQLPGTAQHPKRYITMLASGNAYLTGASELSVNYYGRADQVTYDESNEQYTLRTAKPRYSDLWRNSPYTGRHPVRKHAREILYYPATNKLVVNGGSSITVE